MSAVISCAFPADSSTISDVTVSREPAPSLQPQGFVLRVAFSDCRRTFFLSCSLAQGVACVKLEFLVFALAVATEHHVSLGILWDVQCSNYCRVCSLGTHLLASRTGFYSLCRQRSLQPPVLLK